MKKIKTLIIDDEQNARNNLKILVEDFCPELEVVGLAESAQQARIFLEHHDVELVFLDIAMPNEDGFSFLNSLEKRDFSVIFTTAYNEYALQAFKANAIDYLEKPISIDDLQNAVQKALHFCGNASEKNEQAVQVLSDISKNNSKITVPTRDGFIVIHNEDIIHLEASDNYTMIYLKDGSRHLSSKNIKVYEQTLNEDIFFRTHKSHIINVEHHLKEFSRSEGNMAILTNGIAVPISRRKMSTFISRITTF